MFPHNTEPKGKIRIFGLPESERKKSMELLCELHESFTHAAVCETKLYVLRNWHKELAWEVRGLGLPEPLASVAIPVVDVRG